MHRSSPPSRRLRIDRSAQSELPFPVETAAPVFTGEVHPSLNAPPPLRLNGKTLNRQSSRISAANASGRKNEHRKPPAKESAPPDQGLLAPDRVPPDDVRFVRLPEVKAITGLGKTSIYELIRDKTFPAPVRLGPRAVGWVRSEIMQWAAERVHASRSVA